MYTFFKLVSRITLSVFPLLLSGCFHTYDLISTEFAQAERHDPSYRIIKENIRSTTLYSEFETAAHFDVLWMSDDIRSIYSALHSSKVGHSPQARDAYLIRNLEENNHAITFYVLSDIRDAMHVSLSDKKSAWSFYLRLADGRTIEPTSIKAVDVEPEIRFLFGHRFEPYKRSFIVQFPVKDLVGTSYVNPTDQFSLICASTSLKGTLTWSVPAKQTPAELEKASQLKPSGIKGLLSTFAQWAEPQQRDDDYYW